MRKPNRNVDPIRYEMPVDNWYLSYEFGEPMLPDATTRHDETVTLYLSGLMLSPASLQSAATLVRVHAFDFPLDQRKDDRPAYAGEVSQDRETGELAVSIVMRLAPLGAVVAALGSGTKARLCFQALKLRYRSATIARYWIDAGTYLEE